MRDLTVEDVATQLGVSTETVRRYLRTNELTGFRLGGRKAGWRIPESALNDFRAERLQAPKALPPELKAEAEKKLQDLALRLQELQDSVKQNGFVGFLLGLDAVTKQLDAMKDTIRQLEEQANEELDANKRYLGPVGQGQARDDGD